MKSLLGFCTVEIFLRNKAIATAILEGETFTKVGEDFGLTRERIRQIFQLVISRVDSRSLEKCRDGSGYVRVADARNSAEHLKKLINQAK